MPYKLQELNEMSEEQLRALGESLNIKGFKKEGGVVEVLQSHEVLRRLQPGDLVIGRFRDPLRMLAMKLVNKDVKVHMHPDEVQEFIGDYKAYFTPGELRKKLNEGMLEDFFDTIEQRNIQLANISLK